MPGQREKENFVFWVRVKPRSRKDKIVGWDKDGFLEVHLKAIPQRGEANRSCRKLLAKVLNVPTSCIQLDKGQTSGHKKIRVEGLSVAEGKGQIDVIISDNSLK